MQLTLSSFRFDMNTIGEVKFVMLIIDELISLIEIERNEGTISLYLL